MHGLPGRSGAGARSERALEDAAKALHRRALHVQAEAAQTAEFLAAAGAPGSPVHHRRQHEARPRPVLGDALATYA